MPCVQSHPSRSVYFNPECIFPITDHCFGFQTLIDSIREREVLPSGSNQITKDFSRSRFPTNNNQNRLGERVAWPKCDSDLISWISWNSSQAVRASLKPAWGNPLRSNKTKQHFSIFLLAATRCKFRLYMNSILGYHVRIRIYRNLTSGISQINSDEIGAKSISSSWVHCRFVSTGLGFVVQSK